MNQAREPLSPGERWVRLLLTVTIVVGAVWWYTWPWLRTNWLFPTTAALSILLLGALWTLLKRSRRRQAAERAAQLDREMWHNTLPSREPSLHERGVDERVV